MANVSTTAAPAVGAGAGAGGDVGEMAMLFFAQRAADAKENLKGAIGKAKRDAAINKNTSAVENSIVTKDGGKAAVDKNSAAYKQWQGMANGSIPASADQKAQARALIASVNQDGTLGAEEQAQAKSLSTKAAQSSGAQDDSINMVLVQLALQEFNNAVNGASASQKSIGDTKKSTTDRL